MAPLRLGPLNGHRECALLKVNILPAEAQDLALPKTESYRYDPSAGVPPFEGDRENLRGLASIEGLDFFLFDSRGLSDESWVLSEVATSHCFVQGSSHRPVNLMGGTC
jgi:hypothetical protein